MDVHQFEFADYLVLIGLLFLLVTISIYYCIKHALDPDQFRLLTNIANWLEDQEKPSAAAQHAMTRDRKYAKLREFLTGASKHEVLPASLSLFTSYISPMTLIGKRFHIFNILYHGIA